MKNYNVRFLILCPHNKEVSVRYKFCLCTQKEDLHPFHVLSDNHHFTRKLKEFSFMGTDNGSKHS